MTEQDSPKVRLLEIAADYGLKMQAVAEAYYAEHQKNGCMCDLCGKFEEVYTTVAHGAASPRRASNT